MPVFSHKHHFHRKDAKIAKLFKLFFFNKFLCDLCVFAVNGFFIWMTLIISHARTRQRCPI